MRRFVNRCERLPFQLVENTRAERRVFAHFEVDVEPEVFGLHLSCLSVHVGQHLRVSVLFFVCAAVHVLQCAAVCCSVLQK